ncbi:MAG: VWA domain-containing protein [Phycisphaerales bacterium]|nr:MAG: VWA domain-containing protein [Phycisphaerales bacterium]
MTAIRRVFGHVLMAAVTLGLAGGQSPGADTVSHIVFIIDGSRSISGHEAGAFQLQKQSIRDSLCGQDAFMAADGTVAVAVIQFSAWVAVEIPLTFLDSPATVQAICADIDQITQIQDGSMLAPALVEAQGIFLGSPGASRRFVVLSTDAGLADGPAALAKCRDLRAMTIPVTICTVQVNNLCNPFGPEEDFLKNCANTVDSQEYDPTQPEGHYACAEDLAALDVHVTLCRDCLCVAINDGGADCDANAVPDRCESDCNNNGVLDQCDIRDGTSQDCTGNDIPDECEPDCNENEVADSCDISGSTSNDCNENGVPDECELGACCDDATPLCTVDVAECDCSGRWLKGGACDPDPFMPPCGTSACCEPNGHCRNVSEEDCEALDGSWDQGMACNEACQNCTFIDVCLNGEGECTKPRPQGSGLVGCDDRCCCITQCAMDPYCCGREWDVNCANNALAVCDVPPVNDECWDPDPERGAESVDVPSATPAGVLPATENPLDPGFCCHGYGPAGKGFGTVWYKFVAPEPSNPEGQYSSVRVSTCCSTAAPGAPADDSLVQVFTTRNPDRGVCDNGSVCSIAAQGCADGSTCVLDEQWACENLVAIGCNDDAGDACTCGLAVHPKNSRLCVTGLVPGQTYYVMMAARTEESRGVYRLDISSLCSPAFLTCPSGQIGWIDPPDDVVDARQPHPANSIIPLKGIDEIVVGAPAGADEPCCWALCETTNNSQLHPSYTPELQRNEIVGVRCNGNDTCTIALKRPMAPGEVTTITYMDEDGAGAAGKFTAHPANVNADGVAGPSDILRVIDYLNGVAVSPWGLYSEDVDHSGRLGPPDILRLIDLLNGAGEFNPWLNTPLPDCGDCCP